MRRLVILSDMVLSTGAVRFARIENWDETTIEALLEELEVPALPGVEVYVVGAGATAPDHLSAEQIAGMEEFWRAFFAEAGAMLVDYGPVLTRLPPGSER